jgi:DNA gyrase subunit B
VTLDDADGVTGQVRGLNGSRQVLFPQIPTFRASDSTGSVEIAYQWTTGPDERIQSFVNGATAITGGVHVEGFKQALTEAINRYAHDATGNQLLGSDVRAGLTAVISATIHQPHFGPRGQLTGQDIRRTVMRATSQEVGSWLDGHRDEATLVLKNALEARSARIEARKALDQERQSDP